MGFKVPEHILVQILTRLEANEAYQSIAAATGVSRFTIYRIRDNIEFWGTPYPPRTVKLGAPRRLTSAQVEGLIQYLEYNPCAYVDEMQQWLYDEYELEIPTSTICDILKREGWSRKAVQTRAGERNEELRQLFRGHQVAFEADQIVCVDESAANERTGDRRFGWSLLGLNCAVSRPLKRSERWSLLPALTVDGYIDYMVHHGAIKGWMFVEFLLERVLPKCTPWPGPRSVIVLDNASVHKSWRVKQACAERGVLLLFLPPYSPDFNPIELTFSRLKAWMKRHYQMAADFADFETFLDYAVQQNCRQDAVPLFRKCGWIVSAREGE